MTRSKISELSALIRISRSESNAARIQLIFFSNIDSQDSSILASRGSTPNFKAFEPSGKILLLLSINPRLKFSSHATSKLNIGGSVNQLASENLVIPQAESSKAKLDKFDVTISST